MGPVSKGDGVLMNTNFKTKISNIRKERIKIDFSKTAMDGYQFIWNNYMKWKQIDDFTYNKGELYKC